jgi:hypothetical protein
MRRTERTVVCEVFSAVALEGRSQAADRFGALDGEVALGGQPKSRMKAKSVLNFQVFEVMCER